MGGMFTPIVHLIPGCGISRTAQSVMRARMPAAALSKLLGRKNIFPTVYLCSHLLQLACHRQELRTRDTHIEIFNQEPSS